MILALIIWHFLYCFFLYIYLSFVAPNTDRYLSSCHQWVCFTSERPPNYENQSCFWVYIQNKCYVFRKKHCTVVTELPSNEVSWNQAGGEKSEEVTATLEIKLLKTSNLLFLQVWAPGCRFEFLRFLQLLEPVPLTVSKVIKLVTPTSGKWLRPDDCSLWHSSSWPHPSHSLCNRPREDLELLLCIYFFS